MCLAIPGKIISISNNNPVLRMGKVSFGGIVKDICLTYVPDAQLNDYVIVHAGFAINKLDEAEAESVFSYLEAFAEAGEQK
jgi:hydrogenase expression/formation protein HypC